MIPIILGVIAKEVRQRRERLTPLSRETATTQVIDEARGLGDKGKVMPKLIAQLKGRADGREIRGSN
ncbi:GatB/YqeY domain-containing protein [Dehalococcoidales bacterium]|nr:GatB/YqeY domain-containing protein [Dehalococcoidales bacterium]